MKKLNQKQWGILGTSLGSVLIIVALLTMVGIGSNDTYAAKVTQCSCTTGTYDSTTNKCIVTKTETITCYTGPDAGGATSSPVCSTTSGCTQTGHSGMTVTAVWYRWSCPKITTTTSSCTCPTGTENDGSGNCVEKPSSSSSVCKKGEYKIAGDCVTCTQGSYCPGDGSINACPSDKPKSNAGSSSVSDCKASGSLACKAGEYRIAGDCVTCTQGSYCPGDGSINACPTDRPKSNAGSTSIDDCKASGSLACKAG